MSVVLKPCPLCGKAPHRFRVQRDTVEVIACPTGCKPHWNSVVIHIDSRRIADSGWSDLGDAWNTLEIYTDESGIRRGRFDAFPPSDWRRWEVGAHLPWSPAIASLRDAERAKATGSAS